MSKKKFKDTKVGKFLTDKVPSIVGLVGDVLPDAGVLGVVKGLIQKEPDVILPPEDKEKALKLLEQDMIEMKEITKRWQSDMNSDSWLSKNIRPLILAFLTLTLFIYIILDSSLEVFKISPEWIDLLSSLLLLVYGGYFGARSAEKITKNFKK